MGKSYADEQLELAFEQYSKAIEKFCYTRLGEANELCADCVQDTYCLFYRKLLDGERFENPRAFLYKTANIMVLKAKEKYFKEASRTKGLDEAENVAVYVEDEIERNEEKYFDVDKAKEILISQLNENEKELYQMKYVEKKSLKEIGEILGIPPTTVAKRTSRLRASIKELVEPVLIDFRKGGS
ncbi:MAG: RNA polymerase sigma factor [Eubacterium sp.]